jgi:hypothetical protein
MYKGNDILKLKSIVSNFMKNLSGQDEIKKYDEHLEYYHKTRDPKTNVETTPPDDEKVRVPTVWAFEVFPPAYIENFHQSINRLGWADEKIDAFDDFQDTLHDMRHKVAGGGWINLGWIIDNSTKQTSPRSKTAQLPNGVHSIRASLLQFIPSTTILVCQFNFEDNLANILENPLREDCKTFKKKNKHGYRFISVEHQKKDLINLNREYLNNICSTWLKENFAGIFASDLIEEEHPICALLTLEKNIPFMNNEHKWNNYMSLLDIDNDIDTWKNEKLKGLYLKLPRERNSVRKSIILTGNINEILKDEDLKFYGQTKESSVLNFLQDLDYTLGTWVLSTLLDAYIYKITDLRDLYGKTDINNLSQSISTITELDHQIIKSQRNILPFISEIKHYCENQSYFMHNIYEFLPLNERVDQERQLFSNIRESMIYRIELLEQNERILKETANAARQVNTAVSSDNLAKSNLRMQNSMHKMTWVILLLTLISTFSAVVSIIGKESIDEIKNNTIHWYHDRMSSIK